jgi:hypothetical protein
MPLTASEIYKNLYAPDKKYSFPETLTMLAHLKNKNLQSKEGFYFFSNSQNLITIRKQRYLLANQKIKYAKKFIRLIAAIPFVKAVFICNNLGYQNAPEGSDIDLAIITQPDHIWTARFLSATLMKLLGKRPTDTNRKNKICLSFFITKDNLNLESLAYENDIHFIYWLNQFLPIYISENLDERFFKANAWTKKYLPNYFSTKTCDRWKINFNFFPKTFFEKILSQKLGEKLEKLLKKIQLQIFPKKLKEKAAENNSDVIISDTILKFHNKDKRLEIRDRWLKNIQ